MIIWKPIEQAPHDGEPAPANSLPSWGECNMRVANSEYVEKEGKLRNPHGLYANPLHEFICEYDDNDGFRSGWFMHRLELALNFVKQEAIDSVSTQPQVPLTWPDKAGWYWVSNQATKTVKCFYIQFPAPTDCTTGKEFIMDGLLYYDDIAYGFEFLPAPAPSFGGNDDHS